MFYRGHRRAGMSLRSLVFAAALAGASLAAGNAHAQAKCDLDRPIVFAGLDYDSARFHNAVAMFILQEGFGCRTDQIPGQTIPLIAGLARGDIDVVMEIWTANPAQPWVDAEKAGKAVSLGVNFPDAQEGWFVPRYVVEGPGAPAKDLKSVTDLKKYKALFEDPEEPGKGRFHNCIAGWQCELINTKKLIAYGLDGDFTNFRPGSGEAVTAAVESAIARKRPIVFYYWGPTWLLGKHDLHLLEEPPFDRAVWEAMLAADRPKAATAFPVSEVIVGANAEFAKAAPSITAFLTAYETTNKIISSALAQMRNTGASPEEAAKYFLKTREDVWLPWVAADVAERVRAKL
jgi:glycine betaine/proline transport system substrate-binding protein